MQGAGAGPGQSSVVEPAIAISQGMRQDETGMRAQALQPSVRALPQRFTPNVTSSHTLSEQPSGITDNSSFHGPNRST